MKYELQLSDSEGDTASTYSSFVPTPATTPGSNSISTVGDDVDITPSSVKEKENIPANILLFEHPIRKKSYHQAKWTMQEDLILRHRVMMQIQLSSDGKPKWPVVAEAFKDKSAKKCRDRWENQVNPALTKGQFNYKERKVIEAAHKELGNKWSQIATRLPGRTANDIKNYWNIKKRQRDRAEDLITQYYPDENVVFESNRRSPPQIRRESRPKKRRIFTMLDD